MISGIEELKDEYESYLSFHDAYTLLRGIKRLMKSTVTSRKMDIFFWAKNYVFPEPLLEIFLFQNYTLVA